MILPMIGWLFHASNSATSMMCMVVAIVFFVSGRHPAVARDPRKVLILGIACIVILVVLELVIDLSTTVIAMLGRQPDLTTRVPMWWDLFSMVRNPMVGYGYESFWLGERQFILLDRWGVSGQAHNGYLQVYLDLGLIGVFLLLAWLVSGIRKAADQLSHDYPISILRLCLLVVIVFYNWTEASFHGANLIWSLFIMGGMDIPDRHPHVEFEQDTVNAWDAAPCPDGNHADGRQWKTDAAR
jgi:O-antigen ligase